MINAIKKLIRLTNPIHITRNLWRYQDLIRQMIVRDFTQRYRGSYLGVLWSVLNPLFLLLIYTFVFSVVFKARWQMSQAESPPGTFAIILFAGLIPYYYFSEVINRAPGLIINNPNYVKKVVFPLEILVVVSGGAALFTSLINLGILVAGMLVFRFPLQPTMVMLPLVYLPLILLTLGLAWFLAALGVFIRDIGLLITLALQVLLFVSPIFYEITAVPPRFQAILRLNPLTMIVTNFRNLLLWGEPLDWLPWAIWLVISAIVAVTGYAWFMWSKKGFADVI
jgi:lipopolysaccharide transport system permease protein